MDDVAEGEVEHVRLNASGSVRPIDLWEKFGKWCLISNGVSARFGKKVFYSALITKGFKREKKEHTQVFEGIEIYVSPQKGL